MQHRLRSHFGWDWPNFLGIAYLLTVDRLANPDPRETSADPLNSLEWRIKIRERDGISSAPQFRPVTNQHGGDEPHTHDVSRTTSREPAPDAAASAAETIDRVRQAVAAMPEGPRQILQRVCIHGECASHVGAEMGMTSKSGLDWRLTKAKELFVAIFRARGNKPADFVDDAGQPRLRGPRGSGAGSHAAIDQRLAKDAQTVHVESASQDWTILYHQEEDRPATSFTFEASDLNRAPIILNITDARGTPSTVTIEPGETRTITTPIGLRKIEARASQPRQRLSVNRVAA
jgi:hypothetical protein